MPISLVTLARGAVLLWLLIWASTALAQPDTARVLGRPEAASPSYEPSAADAPLSAGAWVAHGSLTLVPFGGVYATRQLGDERLWATGA